MEATEPSTLTTCDGPQIPDDRALIAEVLQAQRDGYPPAAEQAFAELVRRHKKRIFGIASNFARDHHELEDLCQEVFLAAYRKLGKFRGDAPFEHWVSRIATNRCYDLLRKRKNHPVQTELDEIGYRLADDAPESQRRAREAREILHHAMQALTANQRLSLTLLELEGCSVREAAERTGWSESKVKIEAFRGRKRLRDILSEESGTHQPAEKSA